MVDYKKMQELLKQKFLVPDELDNYFKEGKNKEIVQIMAGMEKVKQIEGLLHGPLVKNSYTIKLEGVIKNYLDGNKVEFYFKNKNTLIAKYDHKEVDITECLKYANFNHFIFEDKYYDQYVEFIKNKARHKPQNAFGVIPSKSGAFADQGAGDLHYGEKLAINVYTTNQEYNYPDEKYYMAMNKFLRGDFSSFDKIKANKNALTQDCGEILTHLGICISGLNKLPQKNLPVATYRGLKDMPEQITQERIEAAKNGGVTTVMSMISTAVKQIEPPGSKGKADQKIMFVNAKGIDVSMYSQFKNEKEILMPPTQVFWHSHLNHKGIDYFIAEPVTTLTNMPEKALRHSIDSLEKLSKVKMQIAPKAEKTQDIKTTEKAQKLSAIEKLSKLKKPILSKYPKEKEQHPDSEKIKKFSLHTLNELNKSAQKVSKDLDEQSEYLTSSSNKNKIKEVVQNAPKIPGEKELKHLSAKEIAEKTVDAIDENNKYLSKANDAVNDVKKSEPKAPVNSETIKTAQKKSNSIVQKFYSFCKKIPILSHLVKRLENAITKLKGLKKH